MFSPDGQWLAFFVGDTLKKVSLTSGASPVTLTDFRGLIDQSIAWLPDNGIVLGRFGAGLFRVAAEGGPPVRLTEPDTEHGEIDHHNPRWLPGGKAMLITRHRGSEAWDVAVLDVETGQIRMVVPDAFDARYLPTGHLVFARGETLLAAPFDVTKLDVSGPSVVMVDRIRTAVNNGAARYAVADDGTLVYVPAISRDGRRLAWVGPNGVIEPLPLEPRAFTRPTVSPDGTRVAVQIDEGSRRDIWVLDLAAGTLNRVTFDGVSESPIWTRDGQRLTYSITKDGRREVYWQPADGSAAPQRLVADTYSVWAGSWSPDGQRLLFTHQPPTDQNDIGIFDLGSRRSALVLAGERTEQNPRLSPDGRWLAYASAETGRTQVIVSGLDGKGGKHQISTDGGIGPVWAPDGRTLVLQGRLGLFRGRCPAIAVDQRQAEAGRPSSSGAGVRIWASRIRCGAPTDAC